MGPDGRTGRRRGCALPGQPMWAGAWPRPTSWPATDTASPLPGRRRIPGRRFFQPSARVFKPCLETFPEQAILLIDTYDALLGAETAAALGRAVPGVRLDSGDLVEKSRRVRQILDARGMQKTKIVASGDLNEYKIEELLACGAPIDLFGVGTDLATSRDVPALSVVYKLVEIERDGRIEYTTKFSDQKVYWPGRKQVHRFPREGRYSQDVVSRAGEHYDDAEPLLGPAMRNGKRARAQRPLAEIRAQTLVNLDCLPAPYHALRAAPIYPVRKSATLDRLLDEARERYLSAPRATRVK